MTKNRTAMLSILDLNESDFLHPKYSNVAIKSYKQLSLPKIPVDDDTYDNEQGNTSNAIFYSNSKQKGLITLATTYRIGGSY